MNSGKEIVREEWFRSADIRTEMELQPDEFVAMPNHIHGIVWIVIGIGESIVGATGHENVGATGRSPLRSPCGPAPRSLGAFIAGFKSAVTKRVNQRRGTPGQPVWQRNYFEHIIRDEESMNRLREYIVNNPLRWHLDRENPDQTEEDDAWDSWFRPTGSRGPTPWRST